MQLIIAKKKTNDSYTFLSKRTFWWIDGYKKSVLKLYLAYLRKGDDDTIKNKDIR